MGDAREIVYKWRWPPDGQPTCPRCGGSKIYHTSCARPACGGRYKCATCHYDFTVLSGTIFASGKKPLEFYAECITILSRPEWGTIGDVAKELGVNYRTAWAIADKWIKSGGTPHAR